MNPREIETSRSSLFYRRANDTAIDEAGARLGDYITDLLGGGPRNCVGIDINTGEVMLGHATGEFQSGMGWADRQDHIARSDGIGEILHVNETGPLSAFSCRLAALIRGPDDARATGRRSCADGDAHITWMEQSDGLEVHGHSSSSRIALHLLLLT